MSGRFDQHTAVRIDDPGGARADVDGTWSGYLGAHGGYLAAIALRSLTQKIDDPQRRPRSLEVHFVEPVTAGQVWLEPRIERAGSTTSMATVKVRQGDTTVAFATGAFGVARHSLSHFAVPYPAVPGPDGCAPLGSKPVPEADMMQYVEHRPAGEPLPFAGADRAEIQVWMRLTEDRPVDDLSAVFLVDAAVPALYAHLTEYIPMPTMQLSVHFGDRPREPSSWALGVFRTRRAAEGYTVEDGELWSPDGTLLLSTRQLRRILAPSASPRTRAEVGAGSLG